MKIIRLLPVVVLMISCGSDIATMPTSEANIVSKTESELIVVSNPYKVVGDNDMSVSKIEIEGHEYIAIWGRLASAPSVIHSASCPCRELK